MNNKKMNLSALKVKSFVTGMDRNKVRTAKGGKDVKTTVITFGYWTACCEDETVASCGIVVCETANCEKTVASCGIVAC